MAKALEVGIGDLRLELATHALVFGSALAAARTVSARLCQALFDDLDDFLVGIERDFHYSTS